MPHHPLSALQNSNTEMSRSHTHCTANHSCPITCCQPSKIAIQKSAGHIPPAQPTIHAPPPPVSSLKYEYPNGDITHILKIHPPHIISCPEKNNTKHSNGHTFCTVGDSHAPGISSRTNIISAGHIPPAPSPIHAQGVSNCIMRSSALNY